MIWYAAGGLAVLAFLVFLVYLTRQNQRIMARTLAPYLDAPAAPAPELPTLPAVFYQDAPARRYSQQVAPVAYAPAIVTQTPTTTPRNVETDVTVPALRSLIAGAIGAIVGVTLAAVFGAALWHGAAVGFVLLLAGEWFFSRWESHRLLWTVERIVGRSLDGDPYVGQPPASGHLLLVNPDQARAQVAQSQAETARRVKLIDLLTFWARCNADGGGTAQREHGIEAGSGAALKRYEEMRGVLFRLGLAEWKNPANHKEGWRVVGDMTEGAQRISAHVKEQRAAA